MTETQFERLMDTNQLDDEYADYIINYTDARIGNGDMLIEAMESGRYYEGFKDHLTGEDLSMWCAPGQSVSEMLHQAAEKD